MTERRRHGVSQRFSAWSGQHPKPRYNQCCLFKKRFFDSGFAFARNDRHAMCHPGRSVSAVEGSFSIFFLNDMAASKGFIAPENVDGTAVSCYNIVEMAGRAGISRPRCANQTGWSRLR